MPKKGGKKHNKKKGAGGGGAKVPDVKNVISPGHKAEDKLMYGEGTAAEATAAEAAPAAASGSAAAAAETATAPKSQEALAQDITKTEPTAAVPGKEEVLPVREKDIVPTDATKEQRGDERTKALAAAAPTTAPTSLKKEAEEDVAKETKISEPEPEHPTTSRSTERADLVAATKGKAEPVVAPINAAIDAVSEVAKKGQIPTEETTGLVTAGGAAAVAATAAGAAVLAGEKAEKGRTQPAESALGKTEAAKEAAHIKRAHEVPVFVTEERDQPSKKPRVDESAGTQPNLAIPGRFPTPSIADSAASGADSAIASEARDISKGEAVTAKPKVSDTAAATTSTQQTATQGPTEAAIAAPAAVPVATKDIKTEEVDTTGTGAGAGTAVSTESPAGEASTQKEPVLPVTPQKADTTAKPTSPAAAAAAAAFRGHSAEQQQKQQAAAATKAPEEVAPSEQAQPTPAQKEAKKGGFMAWIKRKFRGEKSTTTANASDQ
uniref:Otogelin n=1 Tax=Talaromyces marneffei PM1 TaxID=1077442 RepID=A0A093UY52_TALMA